MAFLTGLGASEECPIYWLTINTTISHDFRISEEKWSAIMDYFINLQTSLPTKPVEALTKNPFRKVWVDQVPNKRIHKFGLDFCDTGT